MELTVPQKLWIEALRSGKYKQGKGCLRNLNNDFCCLGVACDLYEKHVEPLRKFTNISEREITYNGQSGALPGVVVTWLDMQDALGIIDKEDISLSRLNDKKGYTFEQIADFIEKRAADLFTAPPESSAQSPEAPSESSQSPQPPQS